MFQIFKCKFCGTNYCKSCGRGDFHGVMTDSAVCRVCFQVHLKTEKRCSNIRVYITKTSAHSIPAYWVWPTEYKRNLRYIIERDFASVFNASFAIQQLAFLRKDSKSKVKRETKVINNYLCRFWNCLILSRRWWQKGHLHHFQICILKKKNLGRSKAVYGKKTQISKAFQCLDYTKPILACFNKMTVLWQHRWTLELSLKLLDQSSFTLHKSTSLCFRSGCVTIGKINLWSLIRG